MPIELYIHQGNPSRSMVKSYFKPTLGSSSVPPPGISLNAYLYGIDSFKNYFSTESGTTLVAEEATFSKNDIENLIAPIGATHAMVAIYHGLKDGNELVHGVRILHGAEMSQSGERKLTPTLDSSTGILPSHEFSGTGFVPADAGDWTAYQSDYYSTVYVARRGDLSSKEPIRKPDDPWAVVIPWEDELEQLFTDNQKPGVPEAEYRFSMNDFSLFHALGNTIVEFNGEDGFRHSIAFNIQQLISAVWTDLLFKGNSVSTLEYRGLDYGNLCPPRHKSYKKS